MGIQQEAFAIFEQAVGVFEVCLALADRFDLGATEGDSALELIGEEIVEAGRAIERGVAFARCYRVAVLLLHGRLGRVGRSRYGH